jgi:hypothetical protein
VKHNQGFRKSEVKDNSLLGDGIFALGLMTGLIIVIVAYLGQQIWGSLLTKSELINVVPAMAAFTIALVSLLISFRALIEQKKMRQAGVDPVLIAHLAQDPTHPLIMTLNISNVGSGAAMNVYASINDSLGAKPDSMLGKIEHSDFFSKRRPVAVILQSQTIPHWMGTGPELFGGDILQEFSVELQYEDIEGATYSSIHAVNLKEFDGRNANEPSLARMVRELEKIRGILAKQSS